MNRRQQILLTVALALCGCSQTAPPPKMWTLHVEEGKDPDVRVIPDRPFQDLLGSYVDELARIGDWPRGPRSGSWTPAARAPFLPPQIKVTAIGKWGSYEVLDVTNRKAAHKSIVLRDSQGGHRILWLQDEWSSCGVGDLPEIVEVDGQSVLAYRTRIAGNGGYYLEGYYVCDPVSGLPVPVDTSAIGKAAKEVLPTGCYLAYGELNFKALTCSHYVGGPGDDPQWPSRGKVEMRLSLRAARLVVTQAKYHADYPE